MGNTGGIISVVGKPVAEKRAVQRQCEQGKLVRLVSGKYMAREHFQNLEYKDRCLARIVAAAYSAKKAVIAGRTAAHILGLPISNARRHVDDKVDLCGFGGADRRSEYVRYRRLSKLTYQRAIHVDTVFGPIVVTDVPTTCMDLARWHSVEDGLVALEFCLNNARQADFARSRGLAPTSPLKLRDRYAARPESLRPMNPSSQSKGTPHGQPHLPPPLRLPATKFQQLREDLAAARIRSANLRTVMRLATAHSESPAETRTKLAMFHHQQHHPDFPTPLQQVPIHFHDGTNFRLDFYFPDQALAVEYDGQAKQRGEFGIQAEHALRAGWDRHTRLSAAGIALFHVSQDADPQWPEQLAARLVARTQELAVRSGPLLRGDVGRGEGVLAWSSS